MRTTDYDVIVIGGGPAGATCAAVLAQHGHKTLVVERTRFPRFHIGESLMPETYSTFRRIGMWEKLKQSQFIKKYSVQFVTASGKESAPFYFDEINPHESSQTWQVVRGDFDRMMLENAAEKGAEVWQESNVTDVSFQSHDRVEDPPRREGVFGEATMPRCHDATKGLPRATGVTVTRGDGSMHRLTANVIVDATGTNALISRKLNIRQADPMLRKASIFAHYRGAFRDPGPRDEGATLVLHVHNQNGWFWYIPLPDDIVSIGVVGDIDYLIQGRGTPEQTLAEEIQKCSFLVPRVAQAERVSPVHVLSDFSYNSKVCAGDGWVLIGDAFTFLDPIYSSGVFLALKSGELAGDAIHEGFVHHDFSAGRLGRWGETFYGGVQSIRKLVYAFYTKDFSFGQFTRAHPEFKKNLVDLLVGDVFRPEVNAIFEPMSKWCTLPEPLKLQGSHGGA